MRRNRHNDEIAPKIGHANPPAAGRPRQQQNQDGNNGLGIAGLGAPRDHQQQQRHGFGRGGFGDAQHNTQQQPQSARSTIPQQQQQLDHQHHGNNNSSPSFLEPVVDAPRRASPRDESPPMPEPVATRLSAELHTAPQYQQQQQQQPNYGNQPAFLEQAPSSSGYYRSNEPRRQSTPPQQRGGGAAAFLAPSGNEPKFGRRAKTAEDPQEAERQRRREEFARESKREYEEAVRRKEQQKAEEKRKALEEDARMEREQRERIAFEREDIQREKGIEAARAEAAMGGKKKRNPNQAAPSALDGGAANPDIKFGRRSNQTGRSDDEQSKHEKFMEELKQQAEDARLRKEAEKAKRKAEDREYDARVEQWGKQDGPLKMGNVRPINEEGHHDKKGDGNLQHQSSGEQLPWMKAADSPKKNERESDPHHSPPPLPSDANYPPALGAAPFGGPDTQQHQHQQQAFGGPMAGFGQQGGGGMMMNNNNNQGMYPSAPQMMQPGSGDVAMLRDDIMRLVMQQKQQIDDLQSRQAQPPMYGYHQGANGAYFEPIAVPNANVVAPPPPHRAYPQQLAVAPSTRRQLQNMENTQQLLDRFVNEDEHRRDDVVLCGAGQGLVSASAVPSRNQQQMADPGLGGVPHGGPIASYSSPDRRTGLDRRGNNPNQHSVALDQHSTFIDKKEEYLSSNIDLATDPPEFLTPEQM